MCRERKRSSEESGRGGKKKKFANSALPFELVIFLCFHLAGSEGGLKMPNPAIERERERERDRENHWMGRWKMERKNLQRRRLFSDFFKFTSWRKFSGIDQITIEAYKGTVTVIGEVDPVCIAGQLRRVRRPNKEEKTEEQKEEEHKEMPICCRYCSGETVVYTE